MKNLRKIVLWLGPLGCVTLCVVGFLILQKMIVVFKKPPVAVSIDTMITSIKKMNLLKPYRVIAAGFSEERSADGNAVLKYQYKGMAEYSVDLSTIECVESADSLELTLSMPRLEKPIMLNLPNPRLWKVDASILRSGKWDEWFRQEEGRIIANRIRADVDTDENRQKAKQQTETTLRYMFSPLVTDVSKVKFKWIK
jgi:hypothetical protein